MFISARVIFMVGLACLWHEHAAGKIELPEHREVDWENGVLYERFILINDDYDGTIDLAARITLRDGRPATLTLKTFTHSPAGCDDGDRAVEEMKLHLKNTRLSNCYSSTAYTMDCRKDAIKHYVGENRAGQLFAFDWRRFMHGEKNKRPLSYFALTDGESGARFAANNTNLLISCHTASQKMIAAHFCSGSSPSL